MIARRLVLLLGFLGIVTIALVPPALATTAPAGSTAGVCGATPADYVGTYHGAQRSDTNPKEVMFYLTLTFTQQLQQHGNPIYEYSFKTANKTGDRSDPPPGVNYSDKVVVDKSNRKLRLVVVSFELADQFAYAGVSSSHIKPLTALGCPAGSTIPERLEYTFPALVPGLATSHLILNRQ
jgi:hypothetical protein